MRPHTARCVSFWGWATVGALLSLGLTSLGLFTVPAGLIVGLLMVRRGGAWPELLGVPVGAGAVCLLIAALNWSGDGLDPIPWLVAGSGLALGGTAAYALVPRSKPGAPGHHRP